MTTLLEELLKEEETLRFSHFDEETAWKIGYWLVEYARYNNLAITIEIRMGDHLLFHASRPGTTAENDRWVEKKARLVNHFKQSSYFIGQSLKKEGVTLEEKWLLPTSHYAPFGGCLPIFRKNKELVGTIAVSGLPQDEDHALVVKAIKTYLERNQNDES